MRAILLIIFAICMLGTCRAQEFTMRCPIITIADSGVHGVNVLNAFDYYADGNYNMNYISSTDLHSIAYAKDIPHTNIISASRGHVIGNYLDEAGETASEQLAGSNSLFFGSLENSGIVGWPITGGFYIAEYNQPSSYYYILDNPQALDQTIFVGWQKKFASGGYRGYVDLENGFVEDNLDHIIFVTSKFEYTSNNTPALAAVAMNILSKNPSLTAEELKTEIFKMSKLKALNILDYESVDGEAVSVTVRLTVNTIEL